MEVNFLRRDEAFVPIEGVCMYIYVLPDLVVRLVRVLLVMHEVFVSDN